MCLLRIPVFTLQKTGNQQDNPAFYRSPTLPRTQKLFVPHHLGSETLEKPARSLQPGHHSFLFLDDVYSCIKPRRTEQEQQARPAKESGYELPSAKSFFWRVQPKTCNTKRQPAKANQRPPFDFAIAQKSSLAMAKMLTGYGLDVKVEHEAEAFARSRGKNSSIEPCSEPCPFSSLFGLGGFPLVK